MGHEWQRKEAVVSTDPARLDLALVTDFLGRSYWAAGMPADRLLRSIEHALVFGLYVRERQAGFARVVTDRARFAYLSDVFVLEPYRGRGLGVFLMEAILQHPDLQGLKRWMLHTDDAHGLYARFGFTPAGDDPKLMQRLAAPAVDGA